MSPPVWCVLACVRCAQPVSGFWTRGSRIPLQALRTEAVRTGATFKPNGDPLCDRCTAETEAAPTNGS